MSLPPIFSKTKSPRGQSYNPTEAYHYFDLDFAELTDLTIDHAFNAFNVSVPDKRRGLLKTLSEVPALFAYILGEHQNLYFQESQLATANLAHSLFREARKLAYDPDMGVSASGYLVFTIKDGLEGTIPKDFALKSSPEGDKKAQIYETLAETFVNAQYNSFQAIDALVPTRRQIQNNLVTLPLRARHGLDKGDLVYLQTENQSGALNFAGVFLVEDPMDDQTSDAIHLKYIGKPSLAQHTLEFSNGYKALSSPKVQKNIFGWNASAKQFPPDEINKIKKYNNSSGSAGTVKYGYDVEGYGNSTAYGSELFLDGKIEPKYKGEIFILHKTNMSEPFLVETIESRSVSFVRGEWSLLPDTTQSNSNPATTPAVLPGYRAVAFVVGGTQTQTLAPNYKVQVIENRFDNRVSTLGLKNPLTNALKTWKAGSGVTVPLNASLIGGWKKDLEISEFEPNIEAFNIQCTVPVSLGALKNGRKIFLYNADTGDHKRAKLSAINQNTQNADFWDILIDLEGGALTSEWTKGNTFILGNVLEVSHGESKSEILGDSDGVTPFQSLALGKSPLTRIAGPDGTTPLLDVRIEDVLWERKVDFYGAIPEHKIYKIQSNPDQSVDVTFGNAKRGSIPQAGSRNIAANYKIGLGKIGNAKAGNLTRQVKTSPIISDVNNPLPINGGVDPAQPNTIKQQATRPIKTFGRAVSVQDHADLAMLFPGVATASARWLSQGQIDIIAADEDGMGVGNKSALLAFLNARRDPHIPLKILDPQAVDISLSVRIEYEPAYFADTVRRNVQDALIGHETRPGGFFTFAKRQLSAPQSLSGVYAFMSELEGVVGSSITVFDLANGGQRKDIIHASDRQWLRLKNQNLSIVMVETGKLFADTGGV